MNKRAHKLIGLFLVLILFAGLIPSAAFAGTGFNTRDGEHVHNGITFTEWSSSDSLPDSEGSYYLTQNVTLSSTWNVPFGKTDLCLNGHDIIMDANGTAVEIRDSAVTLNLYEDDGAHGKITHSTGHSGTGVYVISGNFSMYGGAVSDNTASEGLSGGGVYVIGGTFTLAGGAVSGNRAKNGGGVFLSAGTLNLYGSPTSPAIGLNTASEKGGGIYVNSGTVFMSNGIICMNEAQNGGGVYVNGGIFSVYGSASVAGNIATVLGGGVYEAENGNVYMHGSPTVTGNTASGKANNVYLPTGKTITINGDITGSSIVGVTMEISGKITTGLYSHGSGASFFCDDSDFGVVTDYMSGDAMIVTNPTIYFERVELRGRTQNDGKFDMRFRFNLTLNGAKIKVAGDWYGQSSGTEITDLRAFFNGGSTPFPLYNIFSIAPKVNDCHAFCTFTVVITGIESDNIEYTVSVEYSTDNGATYTGAVSRTAKVESLVNGDYDLPTPPAPLP